MRIHRIFEVLKERLYAASYQDKRINILQDIQDKWSDVIYLEEFFESNKEDLQSGFFGEITIDEAIDQTIEEAEELFERLYEEDGSNLEQMFQPLDNREYRVVNFQKNKAKGSERKSWLRIYAVHFDDQYVITGGTIKLTHQMEDRAHTQHELDKLNIVRDALKLNEADDLFVDV
ncbi:MAG: hypothetical protein NVV82_22520 [Sporocytophaga sp.]|nr:hypothetical protein [Sporocytophaga sp.]